MKSRKDFLTSIDTDKVYIAKRRTLEALSLLLLIVSVSGAVVTEVNTFIFKIEFQDYAYLTYLLSFSVFFMMIRYYSCAYDYHSQLYYMWTDKMLEEGRVIYYDPQINYYSGIISDAISPDDLTGSPKYKSKFFLKRYLVVSKREDHPELGDVYVQHPLPLNKFGGSWTRRKFFRLLLVELKYQTDAFIKDREYLDLLFPYILGLSAIASFIWRIYQ